MTRLAVVLMLVGVLWGCENPLTPTPPTSSPPPLEEPLTPTLPPMVVVGTEFAPQWIGVTAFDAPARVAEGDESYLQWASSTGFTVVRVVVASAYRTYRTPGQGLADLGRFLDVAASYGLYAEVVVGVDTAVYGYHQNGWLDFAKAVAEITNPRTNVIIELANEVTHSTQMPFLSSLNVQREAISYFNAPVSAGSTHGRETVKWDAGSYMTHHPDRRLDPREAVASVAAAQARFNKAVVLDEHIGVAEVAIVGSRVNSPQYGRELGRACREYRVSCTLHLDAGLEAKISQLGPIQDEAAKLFVSEVRQ